METSGKTIKDYTRYEILSNGQVRNIATQKPLKVEDRGGRLAVRLTSDKGVRNWLVTEDLFNQYYQITIENKVGKSAKPAKPAQLSKSQHIWILHKGGLDLARLLEMGFDKGHIKNCIKDYTANPKKQEAAIRTQKLIANEN